MYGITFSYTENGCYRGSRQRSGFCVAAKSKNCKAKSSCNNASTGKRYTAGLFVKIRSRNTIWRTSGRLLALRKSPEPPTDKPLRILSRDYIHFGQRHVLNSRFYGRLWDKPQRSFRIPSTYLRCMTTRFGRFLPDCDTIRIGDCNLLRILRFVSRAVVN